MKMNIIQRHPFNDNIEINQMKKYYKHIKYNIQNIQHFLYHDGYDEWGPESNIYEIKVFYKLNDKLNDTKLYYDIWVAEEWYNDTSDKEFRLISKKHIDDKGKKIDV